jgi:hypothetical protein
MTVVDAYSRRAPDRTQAWSDTCSFLFYTCIMHFYIICVEDYL